VESNQDVGSKQKSPVDSPELKKAESKMLQNRSVMTPIGG